MDKRNRPALAFLLVGLSAAGRALLAVPEGVNTAEISLTAMAVVGYLLLSAKNWRPLVCGAAQLILELVLCSTPAEQGGIWTLLIPVLRAADLWLLWGTALFILDLLGQLAPAVAEQSRRWPARLEAALLAVYTVATILPVPFSGILATVSFVAFSAVLLWYTVLLIRAYNALRVKR